MPDQIGHLPSAKVVIIIEKRCRSIAFVAQSQTSNLSIPTAQARLQGLQADPRRLADALAAHKSPCKTSASTAVRRLALMGQRNQKAYALFTFITRFARLNKQWSGDFRLFPPANFANSAILPTDKISAFFMQNFLLQKPKDSSLLCPKPHRGYERQRAGRTSPEGQCVPAEK